MFLPILLLSLLGATSADFFFHGHPSSRGFSDVTAGPHETHFNGVVGSVAKDTAQVIVEKFLAEMIRAIQTKDISIISILFEPDFVFNGCKGTYPKTQVVVLLSKLPTGANFQLSLKSVTDLGYSIRYLVSASGFAKDEVVAEFMLNKKDQQLEIGRISDCPKEAIRSLAVQQSMQDVVKGFVSKMEHAAKSKDINALVSMFQNGFVYRTCTHQLNKEAIVAKLLDLPARTQLNVKSVQTLGNSLIYQLESSGPDFPRIKHLQFTLNRITHQLESGKTPVCDQGLGEIRHFHGLARAQSDAEVVAKKFLERMIHHVETRDTALIWSLFDEKFEFVGCNEVYNKEQTVQILSHLPANSNFTIKFISARYFTTHLIAYNVSVSGIPVVFLLSATYKRLKSGHVEDCAVWKGFGSEARHFQGSRLARQSPRDAQYIGRQFFERMDHHIKSRNAGLIGTLFQEKFVFYGCNFIHDKKRTIELLIHFKPTFNLSVEFVSARVFMPDIVALNVTIYSIPVVFLLPAPYQQFMNAQIDGCIVSRKFNGFVGQPPRSIAQDNAQVSIEKFLTRMIKTVETHDKALILALFEPDFSFKGCKATYNREQAVALLMFIPRGTQFSYKIKSVEDNEKSINCVLLATGMAKHDVEFDFVLNKKDQQLESAVMPVCPLRRRFANSDDGSSVFHELIGQEPRYFALAEDDAQVTIEKFLTRMIKTVETHDKSLILGLFEPSFIFKGCKATYNREQAVALLLFIPRGTQFSYKIKSVEDNGESINCVLLATGMAKNDVEFDFALNKKDQQLESAVMPVCPLPRRFANLDDGSSVFHGLVGQEPRHLALAQDDAQVTIEKFLTRMIKTVETHDKPLILELFEPTFSFKGCKATYNREQAVALLMFIPRGTQFSYKIKSVEDNGKSINCVLLASGMANNDVEFDFVLNKKDQQLESAIMPVCPLRREFASAPEDSNAVTQRFLAHFKTVMASHDETAILNLFDKDFFFKGCKDTHSGAQALQLITSFASKLSFELKSSKWDQNEQIEFTLTISGEGKGFDAQFVFSPSKNVLKSGSVLSCSAARRFIDFF